MTATDTSPLADSGTKAPALMTAEELARLPDDGFHRYELVRGELRTMAPPGMDHGEDASNLVYFLKAHVRTYGGGRVFVESGVRLARDPDTVRGPDVSYIAEHRLPPPGQRSGFFQGAPDLAVEVVSPSNSAADVAEKVQEYLTAGGRLVWVVDRPRRAVTVHRADGSRQQLGVGDTLSGEDVLPGFALPVAEVFA
jgi:Uma2 family endonuclease